MNVSRPTRVADAQLVNPSNEIPPVLNRGGMEWIRLTRIVKRWKHTCLERSVLRDRIVCFVFHNSIETRESLDPGPL